MANRVKIKRSSVQGKTPTTSQLELGELAVNTYDGKLFTKKDDGTASIVEIGGSVTGVTDGDKAGGPGVQAVVEGAAGGGVALV